MLQVFHHANFKVMYGTKWVALTFSAFMTLSALVIIAVKGFNYGIDFAGGTAVEVRFAEPPRVEALRTALDGAGLAGVSIQSIQRIGQSADNDVLIRVERDVKHETAGHEGGDVSERVINAVRQVAGVEVKGGVELNMMTEEALRDWIASRLPTSADPPSAAPAPDAAAMAKSIVAARNAKGGLFSDKSELSGIPGVTPAIESALKEQATLGGFALRGVGFVGPTAGKELMQNTAFAITAAVVMILLYVWFRFHKVAWGLASVIALVHDVSIAAGAVALTGKEFSLTVVAALLTIVGYSINDTIVVFDRIRENLRLYRDVDFERVVNASVNQTLSRTVLTSFTVFVAVTALFLYGGEKLNPMSFCLMVGVVFGTYSSVWVAAALLVVAYKTFGPKYVKG
jgi:preprotein translocase subunit SecF